MSDEGCVIPTMNNLNDSWTRRPLFLAVLLVAVTLAVFGQVLGHGFLTWDDQQHVLYNPRLNPLTWRGVGQFWTEPYWGLYIPLSYTFFAAEAAVAGQPLDPAVFHLGNLALHVGCVLLVFVILRRLVRHDGAAFAGALLFGLHPVQVESVAWISETRGVLCGLFSLLAVWQYLCKGGRGKGEGGRARGGVNYALATAAFVLALLSKPAAVAVPLVVGVLEVGLLRRPIRRMLLALTPWLLLSAGWVVLTKRGQPDELLPLVTPLWARPLVAGDALAFYLYKLVAPIGCGPDYGRSPGWVMGQGWFYIAWLLPAVVLVALGCLRNRRQWLTAAGISIAWLLPVLGLVPFSFQRISTVADRYLYLSLLGPALALAWFLSRRWNGWTLGITASILCLLGVLSTIQSGHWRNDTTLLAHALRVNPQSVTANHNLGFLFARRGRYVEAIRYYLEALGVDPVHVESHLNLGIALFRVGNIEGAEQHLRKALRLKPKWAIAHYELANVLAARGAAQEAVNHYRAALRRVPDDSDFHRDIRRRLKQCRQRQGSSG